MNKTCARPKRQLPISVASLSHTLGRLLCAWLVFGSSSFAATINWTGGAGEQNPFWDLAANWDLGIPTESDDVRIGEAFKPVVRSSVSQLNSLEALGSIAIAGGSLNVNSPVTIRGDLQWTAGSLGAFGVENSGVLVDGVTRFSGDLDKNFFGGPFVMRGGAEWTGAGRIVSNSGCSKCFFFGADQPDLLR